MISNKAANPVYVFRVCFRVHVVILTRHGDLLFVTCRVGVRGHGFSFSSNQIKVTQKTATKDTFILLLT
jgi:hypothetical protein